MRHKIIAIRCVALHFSITSYRLLRGAKTGPSLGLIALELYRVLSERAWWVGSAHDVRRGFVRAPMSPMQSKESH